MAMGRSALLELLEAVAGGEGLAGRTAAWKAGAAVTTVVASAGYPGSYEKGKAIRIPASVSDSDDLIVFHAGTSASGDGLRTSGGRVLAVTGLGADMSSAAARSRDGAEAIDFEGRTYRSDIGWRELARLKE